MQDNHVCAIVSSDALDPVSVVVILVREYQRAPKGLISYLDSNTTILQPSRPQSRSHTPLAFWSEGERLKKLWSKWNDHKSIAHSMYCEKKIIFRLAWVRLINLSVTFSTRYFNLPLWDNRSNFWLEALVFWGNGVHYPRVSCGAHPLTQKPKVSEYEVEQTSF